MDYYKYPNIVLKLKGHAVQIFKSTMLKNGSPIFSSSNSLSMSTTYRNSWLLVLPALIFNTTEIYPASPNTIQGTITNSSTGKTVEKAYVYIISGEEEALTDRKGVFSIATWQELPLTVIVEHPAYKKKKLVIKDASEHQFIRLDPK